MSISVLSSTLLLTLLTLVGLVFFIRASVKPRIQQVRLATEQSAPAIAQKLRQYLDQRAYQVSQVDTEYHQVTFQGLVRPSPFLAVFLSVLAAIGGLCFALVLLVLFPDLSGWPFGLVLLSPLAGVFYWRKAARPETVSLRIEEVQTQSNIQSIVTVTAHRDELAELQRQLALQPIES